MLKGQNWPDISLGLTVKTFREASEGSLREKKTAFKMNVLRFQLI